MNSSQQDVIQRYTFIDAVRTGNSTEVARLLDSGACSVHERDEYRRTGVHLAVLNNDSVTCALLLSRGAFRNARDDEGQTPMHYWSLFRDTDMLRLLQHYGADTVAYRNDGVSVETCARDMNVLSGDIVTRRKWHFAAAAEIEQEARDYLKRKALERQSLLTDFEQAEAHKQKKSRGGV